MKDTVAAPGIDPDGAGTSSTVLSVAAPAAPSGYWRSVAARLLQDRFTCFVALLLFAIFFMAAFAPLFTSHDPYAVNVLRRLKPIGTPGYWLGTDETGRDMWTRLLYGGRLSLMSGMLPVTIAVLIGGGLGIVAGYMGGVVNTLVMRTMDVFYAFPSVLLAISICGLLGAGIGNAMLALSLVFIAPMTRIAESVTTGVRNLDFIDAARASGTTPLQVVRHHVLANVMAPILVYATSLFSVSTVLGAGLSFLGLGATPPSAEWGLMLNSLRQAIYVQPLVAALPGVMIFMTSMCFNLLSDGVRQAMDVRLNR